MFWERKTPVGLSRCVEVSLSGCSLNISSRESGRHGNFGNHSCRAKNYLPAIKLLLNTGFVTHCTLSWFGYRGLSLILFWVLALPKSGVVVVLSSNTSIGVKVVLDFFLFFFLGGGGICRRSSDHVRVWDAGDLITPFLMYRICHPARHTKPRNFMHRLLGGSSPSTHETKKLYASLIGGSRGIAYGGDLSPRHTKPRNFMHRLLGGS